MENGGWGVEITKNIKRPILEIQQLVPERNKKQRGGNYPRNYTKVDFTIVKERSPCSKRLPRAPNNDHE